MEQISGDERISSIENKLKSLIQRLSILERRLSVLERSPGTFKKPTPPPKPTSSQPTKINHNYLNRAIRTARRDYERKYR